MPSQPDSLHIDTVRYEVRRGERVLRLEKIPMELLILLAEKKGQLVSREEITEKLWGKDVFLDTEQGINTAIRKIRQALSDDAEQSRYIQTVVGKGYRFIGPIKVTANGGDGIAGQPVSIQEKATFPIPLDRSRRLPVGVIVVAALALGSLIAFALLIGRVRQQRVEPLTLSAVPFTTYEGTETMPRLSPDGSQVAFSWDGDPPPGLKGFDLYVKVIGSENLLRVTRRPSAVWIGSAWSPDHTQIAFHRISGSDTGVYVVPALGGPERKLRSTRISVASPGSPIDWSPDGKWIVFQDVLPPDNLARLYLLSPETLETRQIPHAPECLVEASPAFSHDGKHLAYTCLQDLYHHKARIYTVVVSDRQPKPITTLGDIGWWGPQKGLAWSADDKRLIFPGELVEGRTGDNYELMELTLADGSLRRIRLGQSAIWPTISKGGGKLAYATYSFRFNIWRKDLLNPESAAAKLISSTREEWEPRYSPDGKHIAFISTRGGTEEIWMSDPDGSQPVQVSDFRSSEVSDPSWSPDGKKIAFDTHQAGEVYIVDISERVSRKLNTNINAEMPSWSHDGKWIYFRSLGEVRQKIYRCPSTGGDASVIADLPPNVWAMYPTESFDGETIYFTSFGGDGKQALNAVSLRKPSAKVVLEEMPAVELVAFSTIVPGGVYFVPADAPKSLCYFDFRSKRVRPIFESDKRFWFGFSVSPDGHHILYSKVDEENQDIMLADKFR